MKYVLIVDDNPSKLTDLAAAAGFLFPQAEIERFECSDDLLGAIRGVYAKRILEEPDEHLLVVDMQMPPMTGARIDINGGLLVLRTLRRLQMRCPAIIASSEPIDEERAREAYDYYKGSIHYCVMCSSTAAMKKVLSEYLPLENS